MELKIRIKEVVEEQRELTLEEQALWSIGNTPSFGWSSDFLIAITDRLKEIGLHEVVGRDEPTNIGKFRKETIRDATPLEGAAWHHLQQCKYCDGCKVMDGKRTKECIFCGIAPCPSFSGTKQAAEKLLEGKEIILELVE